MLHPLILAVLAADLAAVALVVAAAIVALRVLLHWRPESADAEQLRLERRREVAVWQAGVAALLFASASIAAIVAVASALPALVPGAMCGTGVLEAMGGAGGRAILLRVLALGSLGALLLVDGLDRTAPRAPLAEVSARTLLIAAALVPIAAWSTWSAFLQLDVHHAVDCCAAVYDPVAERGTGLFASVDDSVWLGATVVSTLVVVASAARLAARPDARRWPVVLGSGGPLLAIAAGGALVRVLSAYRYGVLAHHCPWCLFLAEHGRVGYPLLLALWLVGAEGVAAWLATAIGERHAGLAPAARRRTRRAAVVALAGVLGYLVLAVGPALLWRWRHGTWLG
ncbi:MAG: hypothetical protein IPM29_28280 [Planctomycetes bacterium]|nr:hypothetical protein [Planctomycetota bacterium]